MELIVMEHVPADPVLVTSVAASPDIGWLKESMNVGVRVPTGLEGSDHVAEGIVETSDTEDAAVSIAGPEFPAASVVELASKTTSSVPVEEHVTETEIDVPELAPTAKMHPEAVPRFEKSAADIPKMLSPKLMM